ncbi:MAG: potassium transporter TrkG [Eubacteriales bacterium]|nr:potassium transporter TrkG [Eubacteriales bacterium]
MKRLFRRLSPARILALGFAGLILLGSLLLSLPCCVRPGVQVSYLDILYTAVSAVCVTGLVVVDVADTFTALGQWLVGLLIQIGGLGVATVGAGVILMMGKKVSQQERTLIREAMNLDSGKGVIRFIKSVFFTTLIFEGLGTALSYPVFARNYPPLRALGVSLFHAVASFNNAGFDILGSMQNLIPYRDDVLLNLVTCLLIFFGGIGFLVIREMLEKRLRWRRFSMHTKVVLSVSLTLTAAGALLLWLTEDMSFLSALFHSVSARTAGFSTVPLGTFSNAGLLVIMLLMVIGASPGSTGGGVKTSTFFALLAGIRASATNTSEKAFHYALPREAFRKAAVIMLLALGAIGGSAFLMAAMEPELPLRDILFEMASAFGTVGLSTGITPRLSPGSKMLSMGMMFIGRLGPMTIASLWYFSRGEHIHYPEGNIAIG